MPINLTYKEIEGSFETLVIVEDPKDSNKHQEFRIPTFMFDLVKPKIDDGTMNLTTLGNRKSEVSKVLP